MNLKYRPEIDGLRAIAVIAVILYHAQITLYGVSPFQGGFVGVDIFFVISGYLIASIILRDMQSDSFRFAAFYMRRARRILPALFTVMLVSLPFAWIYMLPKGLEEYAGSALSALGFGSNFWFWLEDSYTAEPSLLKPLLHTWTLAVEEQFYIFFPLFLAGCMAFARRYILSVFVLGFLVSLQAAESASGPYPDATFYLLHTRLWELLIGAILAKIALEYGRKSLPVLDDMMPALGLFLIAYSIIFFEDTMRHPSYMTLVPVAGTILLIWFGGKGELVSDILSSRLFVGVGLISYSLYLWHYPVFAFARLDMGALSSAVKAGCVALTFVLAIASYYAIERPMRYRMADKLFLGVIMMMIVVLIAANVYILKTDGAKFRMATYETLFDVGEAKVPIEGKDCFQPQPELGQHCKFTRDGAKGTLIGIGDSHLAMFGPALKALAERHNMNYEQFPNCVFILGTELAKLDGTIEANTCPEEQLEALVEYKDAVVVKLTRLTHRITGENVNENDFADQYVPVSLDETIEGAILRTNEAILAQGHALIQVYPVPELLFHAPHKLKMLLKGHEMDYKAYLPRAQRGMQSALTDYHERHAQSFSALDSVQGKRYLKVYPHRVLCDEESGVCDVLRDGHLLYRDTNHLSSYGASLVAEAVDRALISAQ